MRTEAVQNCFLCNIPGAILYDGLRDYLFGTTGSWGMDRCPRCVLTWLDPRPTEEDIAGAYQQYYTHGSDERASGGRHARLIRVARQMAYRILGCDSLLREHRKIRAMYLSNIPPGRLLDVGCGNGMRMLQFQRAGWIVEGQEVDPEAAKIAREITAASVYSGPLESLNLPDNSYDVITMNHVLEHVHRPVDLLKECGRILRPGGIMVAVTPNASSHGHRLFGRAWRGLEPPRHIFLYSPDSIARLAEASGFRSYDVWTSAANAEDMYLRSNAIRMAERGITYAKLRIRLDALRFVRQEHSQNVKHPGCGEDLVLRIRS
jgi:SAM-dependent methyltransferase